MCFDRAFLLDIATNCIGAFFGFTLSIFIYRYQVQKEKKKEYLNEYNSQINLLKYYAELIRKNIVVTKKNIALINKYTNEQEKSVLDLLILQRVPSYDFTRLINVDNKGVFIAWVNIFKEKDSISEYQMTNSSIDILEGVIKEIHRMNQTVTEHAYKKLLSVKEIVDNLPDHLTIIANEIANELKEKRYDDPFFRTINNYVSLYGKLANERKGMPEFMEEFVKPLITELNSDYRDNPYSMQIIMLCKKSRVKAFEVSEDMDRMLEEFKTIDQKIKEPIQILEKAIKKIGDID